MAGKPKIDVADPRFKADPYPVYARLREEAPVCRVRAGRLFDLWLVTRYDDVAALLKDERFLKDPRKVPPTRRGGIELLLLRLSGSLNRHMLAADPPDHTRLRALVQKAFTPRLVEGLRPRIAALTEELLDRAAGRASLDVVRDLALPLPSTIIAEMLGVPLADRKRFLRWSAAVTNFRGLAQVFGGARALWAFRRYLRGLVELRRRSPQDDLVSALVSAEEAGDRLDADELLAMIFLLLVAGYETTVNLIGNGTLALLEHPEQWEKLRANPALVASAVEELLRYEGPLELATHRWSGSDLKLGNASIRRGDIVAAGLAYANRDPAQFDRPDALDLAREPNRHLAFGAGIHYCLGAPLARLEGQIAFNALLRRFPQTRLAVPRSALRWRTSLVMRGLESLPIARA